MGGAGPSLPIRPSSPRTERTPDRHPRRCVRIAAPRARQSGAGIFSRRAHGMRVPGLPCPPRSRTERRSGRHSTGAQNRRSVLPDAHSPSPWRFDAPAGSPSRSAARRAGQPRRRHRHRNREPTTTGAAAPRPRRRDKWTAWRRSTRCSSVNTWGRSSMRNPPWPLPPRIDPRPGRKGAGGSVGRY